MPVWPQSPTSSHGPAQGRLPIGRRLPTCPTVLSKCRNSRGQRMALPHSVGTTRYHGSSTVRIRFLTSTPLDVRRGSGTYVGIHVLAQALEAAGHAVEYQTPRRELPVYTAQRLLFNRSLTASADFDLTVGFDMDGYRIARGVSTHVASLKGVIADELRFEAGITRLTMSLQALCERLHVERA